MRTISKFLNDLVALEEVRRSREELCADRWINFLAPETVLDGDENWPLEGRDAVSDYLISRFEFLASEKKKGRDLGVLKLALIDYYSKRDKPCLVFELAGERQGVYFVKTDEEGKITRLDMLGLIVDVGKARYIGS